MVENRHFFIPPLHSTRDGQTTVPAIAALCIASHGKNYKSLISFCITLSLEPASCLISSVYKSTNHSSSHAPHFNHGSSCTSSSFLPSLTHLFHTRLKPTFSTSLSHHRLLLPYAWTAFVDLLFFRTYENKTN